MNIRNILLLTGLAAFLAGCVVHPRPYPPVYEEGYDNGYYDYRGTPSYEGYYYARIIFIGSVPYYVDDDRNIRPIPARLHNHFRRYPYSTLARPPVFSADREVRDGYPVSRIIYLNGVPYNVGNDRNAQPLPDRLRPRFRYTPSVQGNAPPYDNRPQQFDQRNNDRSNEPPMRNQDRDRMDRDRMDRERMDRDRMDRDRQDRDRMAQPPVERGQREDRREAPAESKEISPFFGQRNQPSRQDQPNTGASHADTSSGNDRDRSGNRPQAADDSAKKKTDKNADKNRSRDAKKAKTGDNSNADDNNKNDNGKKPRNGTDGDQQGSDSGNSIWRK
jgi:hypothetical protein